MWGVCCGVVVYRYYIIDDGAYLSKNFLKFLLIIDYSRIIIDYGSIFRYVITLFLLLQFFLTTHLY